MMISSDVSMARMFWEEKQDPTRYEGWDRVVASHPEIEAAWRECNAAMARFGAALDELCKKPNAGKVSVGS